jgi:hypothetical protein
MEAREFQRRQAADQRAVAQIPQVDSLIKQNLADLARHSWPNWDRSVRRRGGEPRSPSPRLLASRQYVPLEATWTVDSPPETRGGSFSVWVRFDDAGSLRDWGISSQLGWEPNSGTLTNDSLREALFSHYLMGPEPPPPPMPFSADRP